MIEKPRTLLRRDKNNNNDDLIYYSWLPRNQGSVAVIGSVTTAVFCRYD